MRTLAMSAGAEPRSLTSLREKLIKIGAKAVSHGRYVIFQITEVAVPRQMFHNILQMIARLRAPPAAAESNRDKNGVDTGGARLDERKAASLGTTV
jgi:hypothetical protein